jgi:hypothetical protein
VFVGCCFAPDAFRQARGVFRSLAARRRRRRLLERLWRDEVGVGRGAIASPRLVATTTMVDTSGFFGDAA